VPLLSVLTVPKAILVPVVAAVSLTWLAFLGGLAARVGGAPVTIGAIRVTFWGALAMGLTAGVGALFGTLM
jgi:VIT1/CCC1 family predicted Fe2+/Mn2+ transporter